MIAPPTSLLPDPHAAPGSFRASLPTACGRSRASFPTMRSGAAILPLLLWAAFLWTFPSPALAQEPPPRQPIVEEEPPTPPPGDDGWGLRLMAGDVGIGIGHVPRVIGLRVNLADRHLDQVDGVNLTLWRPGREEIGGRVHGIAAGLLPQAGTIRGLGLGAGAVVGEEALDGVHGGGLAVISGGNAHGIHLGGIATIAGDDLRGVQLGGAALIAGEQVRGAQLGGLALLAGEGLAGVQGASLAVISGGAVRGIQGSGLAVIAGGDALGLQAGGLAAVAGGRMRGLQASGVATVAGCAMEGIQIAGGVVEAHQFDGSVPLQPRVEDQNIHTPSPTVENECTTPGIRGATLAGFRVRAPSVQGVTGVLGWLDAGEVRGLSVAGYHRSQLQVGLSIGVVNWTDRLHGVQLGLLNHAGNNRRPFRTLPLLNLNL